MSHFNFKSNGQDLAEMFILMNGSITAISEVVELLGFALRIVRVNELNAHGIYWRGNAIPVKT